MNCPICGHNKFEVTGTGVFQLPYNKDSIADDTGFDVKPDLICCAKCHVTIFIRHNEPERIPDWKEWYGSTLIWNEERQRLESSPSKRQTIVGADAEARIDNIKKDIASLSPETIGELLEMFNRKEEKDGS